MYLVEPFDHSRVAGTDGVGIGNRNGQGQFADLVNPCRTCHLSVAVEAESPCGAGPSHAFTAAGENGGDTRANRSPADGHCAVATDQRRVADFDSGDVRDGILWTRRAAQFDTEVTGANIVGGQLFFFLPGLSGSVRWGMSEQRVATAA
jgi:hypothetical protein